MESPLISGQRFGSGSTFSNDVVDHVAVPMHGPVNTMAAPASDDMGSAPAVVARISAKVHQTVDKLAETAIPTADWLSANRETLAANGRTAVTDTRHYVTANPWQCLGVALAAGFLLGRLSR